MNKKAQAAMEFLMTYGWAILVVIAAIAALAYFGVLDPARLLPEKCEFPAGVDCVDKPSIDSDADTIQLALKNNIGFKIHIVDVSSANTTNGCSVSAWDAGSGSGAVKDVLNNGGFTLSLTCGNDVETGKFGETIYMSYRNNETGLTHKATGVIRGKA